MKNVKKIRVRFAPSPTGWLHIGSARTALFNYLFAKKNKGKFILRIEDTDIERSKKNYEKEILDSLRWLGLKWDEGPHRQSERKKIYEKNIKKLLNSGQAFWCSHTPQELKAEKEQQMKKGLAPRHICDTDSKFQIPCLAGSPRCKTGRQTDSKRKGVIRFRAPEKKIIFNDLIRGKIKFEASLLGDFAIAKNAQTPLYNLAAAVDDADMKISHIIRGEDHISNTPKQILLCHALGIESPKYAHIPLILGPDKTKLSKRHGATAISEYKKQGYLPEALVNFLAFLGWNPGDEREFFTLAELEKEFTLERVGKSAAIFNIARLNYLNGHYIRQLSVDKLYKLCLPYLDKKAQNHKNVKKIIALEQERLKKLNEIGESAKFFFKDKLKYKKELLRWKDMSDRELLFSLDRCYKILSNIKNWRLRELSKSLLKESEKIKNKGMLLWPLRVALSGQKASPPPFEIMEILGKEETLKKIKKAKKKLT